MDQNFKYNEFYFACVGEGKEGGTSRTVQEFCRKLNYLLLVNNAVPLKLFQSDLDELKLLDLILILDIAIADDFTDSDQQKLAMENITNHWLHSTGVTFDKDDEESSE